MPFALSEPATDADEQVSFVQYHLPGLPVGNYQLDVAQQVNDANGKPLSDGSLNNAYTFAVQGDQFSISQPASVVYAVFPAANAVGEFGAVLPHVVFAKKTFPWSRSPLVGEPVPPTPGANVPTWLTVLVLDADDVARYPSLNLTPQPRTVGDLFPNAAHSGSTLGTNPDGVANLSYFAGATDTSGLGVGQQLTDAVQTLDVPLPLFWELAPSLADLNYAAHARQVSLVNKATLPGISDAGTPVGDFSIVFGNRVAGAGTQSRAYLVSLEGLRAVLPNADDSSPTGYAATCFVRLAVLQSWSYYSTGQQGAFTDTLQALNGRVYNPKSQKYEPASAAITTLALPYAGENSLVTNALATGYVPLNHQLRNGGSSVAWYRGPLLPCQVPTGQVIVPLASADQATRFDPTTGLLDTSYAAAWTLGRWLALQDKGFSTALYNWKNGLQQAVLLSIEKGLLAESLLPTPPPSGEFRAAAPLEQPAAGPISAGRRLQRQLLQVLSQ